MRRIALLVDTVRNPCGDIVSPIVGWTEFQQAALVGQIHDGVHGQPMRGRESAEFFETAFPAAVHHQHGEVEFGSCPDVADRFHDQQAARRVHGFGAAGQNAVGVVVIPVVEDIDQ